MRPREQNDFGVWYLVRKERSRGRPVNREVRGRGRVRSPCRSEREVGARKEQQRCYRRLAGRSVLIFPHSVFSTVLGDKGGPLENPPFSFCSSSTSPALC